MVKPLDFIARGPKGLVQPALKCRGREYLRIIYGPEYTADDQLPRLRSRGLSGKRSLAAREFRLGIEALERFVAREPLRRVHECVFGVLALESEPVDPTPIDQHSVAGFGQGDRLGHRGSRIHPAVANRAASASSCATRRSYSRL